MIEGTYRRQREVRKRESAAGTGRKPSLAAQSMAGKTTSTIAPVNEKPEKCSISRFRNQGNSVGEQGADGRCLNSFRWGMHYLEMRHSETKA